MRTRFLLILLGFVTWPASLHAQELEASLAGFDAGTELVRQGRYEEAIQTLDSALANGFETAALHYNQGVAYYRMDRLAEAIASFERARRLEPDNRMVRHNLSIARAQLVDKISQLPTPIGARLWQWLDGMFGATGLFAAGLLGWFLLCAILAIRWRSSASSDWIRRALWASGSLALVGISLGLGLSLQPANPPSAVVLESEAPLFSTPDPSGSVVLQVHEGLMVTVVGRAPELSAVRLPNGVTGWIDTGALLDI